MVRLLASVIGLGIETAYLLVLEVFRVTCATAGPSHATRGLLARRTKADRNGARKASPRRAMPAYASMIQLAWRFLLFQKDSALAEWFRTRTEGASGARKTKMIVALARKLLIALWRMVTTGEVPHGVVLRQAT
jgi:transposase